MSHGSDRNAEVIAPRSRLYQGPFGRICSGLEPWTPDIGAIPKAPTETEGRAHFLKIARDEMVEAPGKTPAEVINDTALREQLEAEFDSDIPAGYTYFGQFIDHDITFDPASSLMRQNDPGGLLNHRTPRFDLDNVYGRGPDDSPYLYDRDSPGKLLIGSIAGSGFKDLPRNSQGRALIGDMRNDENAIVPQLQLAFLLAHNTLVDRARDAGQSDPFESARNTLRWLYQHVVWNDFIRRITIDAVREAALTKETTADGRHVWKLGLEDVYKWHDQPYMPVEFSVAAYRFGHSMVRNAYRPNFPIRGLDGFVPLFDVGADDLRGFRPMRPENVLQWDWFLEMGAGGEFPQKARKIDDKLGNALAFLPASDFGDDPMTVLAFRNLMRGWRFDLPSGTDVARKFGVSPIAIDPDHDALWFYILREAASVPGANAGQTLGRVGSTIVCAVFAGLLKGDPKSFLNIDPDWTPDADPLLLPADNQDPGDWTLASIIRLSGLPVSAGNFPT